eukprot:2036232-Alexandrium_andersonii.AAC.1
MLPDEQVEAEELEVGAAEEDPEEVVAAEDDGAPAAFGPCAVPSEPASTPELSWLPGFPPPARCSTRAGGSAPAPAAPGEGPAPAAA